VINNCLLFGNYQHSIESFVFNFLVDFRERSAKLIEIESVAYDEVSTLETPKFNIDY
jgi:hypothetical protein